jgi:hypothetical protein
MKFKNFLDLIQVFANEYCSPVNTILILGLFSPEIKNVFEFIGCDTIFVNDFYDKNKHYLQVQ